MPTQNRDQERLYPPGKLSRHFALWSTLLLVVLVWMLWQDFDRPWKDYQKDVRAKQIWVAEQKLRREADDSGAQALAAQEAEVLRALADLPRTNPELAQLERDLPALKTALLKAEARDKDVKGYYSPARYEYEMALHRLAEGHGSAGDVASRLETYNRWASETHRAVLGLRAAAAEHDKAAQRIAEIKRPLTDRLLALRRDPALLQLRGAQAASEGLTQRYDRNPWRNWLVLEILGRSIEVKQLVLKDIHDNWNFATNVKVDRCITCHLGYDQPDLSDESIAALFEQEIAKAYKDDPQALEKFKAQHGLARWMQPHPAPSLIAGPSAVHQAEHVGCTTCHAGVGWSTDFARAAHTPASHEQREEWTSQHGWKPPQFVEYPMLLREYVQGQCFKCHKEGFGWPTPYVERLGHGVMYWNEELKQLLPVEQIAPEAPAKDGAPRRLHPLEMYGALKLPSAPGPVDGPRRAAARVRRLTQEADLLKAYEAKAEAGERWTKAGWRTAAEAVKPSQEVPGWTAADVAAAHSRGVVADHAWDAEAYDLGEESISRYGCQGCHKIADFNTQVGYDKAPPRVGPNLSYLADKVSFEWLLRWVKHPDAYRIDTRMPSFFWFVPKNKDWQPVDADGAPLAGGALRPVPVLDSHLFDRDAHLRELGPQATPDDLARFSIQILAMSQWMMSQGRSRANPQDPEFNPAYATDPLPGDWEKGRETVGNEGYGCIACHVVPEIKDESGAWVKDLGERFRGEPAQGPRIDALGSKFKPDGRALNAWLERPRHYTSTTQMPDMRWKAEVKADGTVVRSAEQVRADVVAYLLRYRHEAFDALPGVGWDDSWMPLLQDMYEEYFGRKNETNNLRRDSEVRGEFQSLGRDKALARVGEKLMARNGCFGCHEVKGHEEDQPIGTELSTWGNKDLHQLDFGYVHAVPHTRAAFARTKITHPRVWDQGRSLRWTDRLRMPRFNFRMDDHEEGLLSTRASVTGIVLGLVNEPIKEGALYKPDEATRDIIRFRRVVERYSCNSCHPIEGQLSVLWRFLGSPQDFAPDETPDDFAPSAAFDLKYVPPNLFGQGHRTQADWLQQWLREPHDLRPMVRQRMPRFELSVAEADALVAGFQRLAGVTYRVTPQPASGIAARIYAAPVEIQVTDASGKTVAARTVSDAVEEAEFLFDTINCNKCHLPKGSPGSDPTDGGVAPPLKYAQQRLGREWVNYLLHDPQHLIKGTAMVSPWGRSGYGRVIDKAYQPFQFELRDDPAWQALWKESEQGTKPGPARDQATKRLFEVQREALSDYVTHHYSWPRSQPAEPR